MPELFEINLVQTMTTRRQTENEICHKFTAISLSAKGNCESNIKLKEKEIAR